MLMGVQTNHSILGVNSNIRIKFKLDTGNTRVFLFMYSTYLSIK